MIIISDILREVNRSSRDVYLVNPQFILKYSDYFSLLEEN